MESARRVWPRLQLTSFIGSLALIESLICRAIGKSVGKRSGLKQREVRTNAAEQLGRFRWRRQGERHLETIHK
jgi:hypothetical protein